MRGLRGREAVDFGKGFKAPGSTTAAESRSRVWMAPSTAGVGKACEEGKQEKFWRERNGAAATARMNIVVSSVHSGVGAKPRQLLNQARSSYDQETAVYHQVAIVAYGGPGKRGRGRPVSTEKKRCSQSGYFGI